MGIPQPVRVEWAPADTPLEATPTWETLDRVYGITAELGRQSSVADSITTAGQLKAQVRNAADQITSAIFSYTSQHRWRQIRLVADIGSGDRPLFTGYITDLDFDTADGRFASRVDVSATDAIGVWTQSKKTETLLDPSADLLGFDTAVSILGAEVAAALGTTVDTYSVIDAPVALPAQRTTDGGATTASFDAPALEALRKALDVELGAAHIGPNGHLVLNGRYSVPDAMTSFYYAPWLYLTDSTPGGGAFPYRRGSLKMASPMRAWKNQATATGLRKNTKTAGTPATGYPVDSIDQNDLWTTSDRWVQANAALLAALHANIATPYPAEVSVVLWDPSMTDFTLAGSILDSDFVLGRARASITASLPGAGSTTWVATIEGIRHTITNEQWIATLRLGYASQRWIDAYPAAIDPGIFSLDTTGRGLDAGAILGP